jgi:hypothetical protein
MALTPEQRSMRARLAALARWSKEDPADQMKIARARFDERFEKQVDPDCILPPEERARRAAAARKAYFVQLGFQSSRRATARKAQKKK